NYLTANETPEGGKTYYVVLAFEPNTTEFNDNSVLDQQEGTVDFIFTDDSSTTNLAENAQEGSNDYLKQSKANFHHIEAISFWVTNGNFELS
ncbi:MAG: hypothetical protein HRU38_25140, partial [Saccharospirillaceae bacterium]|nr:hypothetical protein [Saccharospirillaceae bacterium]